MKSFVAAVFLIACLVEFTLAFIFFVPVDSLRWRTRLCEYGAELHRYLSCVVGDRRETLSGDEAVTSGNR